MDSCYSVSQSLSQSRRTYIHTHVHTLRTFTHFSASAFELYLQWQRAATTALQAAPARLTQQAKSTGRLTEQLAHCGVADEAESLGNAQPAKNALAAQCLGYAHPNALRASIAPAKGVNSQRCQKPLQPTASELKIG